MDSSPLRAVTFCRFGYDESLTLDRVVQLIEQKDLWADELLQIDGANEWTAARDVPQLRPYFGDGAARPVDARQRRPYERGERPPFRMVLTQDDEAEAGPGWPDRPYVMACGAIFVAFSAVWLFLTLRDLNVEWQSRRWPTTTGIAVRTSSNDDGSQDVTYDYVVARGQYRAEDTLRYVRKGDEVTVRYNPLRPDQSTLNDGIQGRTLGVGFGGVVMMMFGAGMLMFPARAAAFFNEEV